MAKKETYTVTAAADAPDEVSVGNLRVKNNNGKYVTDDPKFAAYLQSNYGGRPIPKRAAARPKSTVKSTTATAKIASGSTGEENKIGA